MSYLTIPRFVPICPMLLRDAEYYMAIAMLVYDKYQYGGAVATHYWEYAAEWPLERQVSAIMDVVRSLEPKPPFIVVEGDDDLLIHLLYELHGLMDIYVSSLDDKLVFRGLFQPQLDKDGNLVCEGVAGSNAKVTVYGAFQRCPALTRTK